MDEGYVLVIGSAGIDIKARPNKDVEWNMPNEGHVYNNVSGVARNIAENLQRLEVDTIMLTAIGDDEAGERVLKRCLDAGINCDYIPRIAGERTGTYVALQKPTGGLHVAISDYEIMQYVDSDYLHQHELLFADAEMLVIDATLSDAALQTVFELAERHHVRVCADPTTPKLAARLRPYVPKLYLVVPNAGETKVLSGLEAPAHDRDTATNTARHLVSMGAKIAVVTLGDQGLAYAHSNGGGFIRARRTEVVDESGAGDAFTGAVIFGLLNELAVDEAMRLGITAASLTLEVPGTVIPYLSQEMLYDELVV